MIVYLITNRITGKKYVGKTVKDLDRRWRVHLAQAKSGLRTHLHRSIRKYGAEIFEKTVLSVALNKAVLGQLEKFWIAELGTRSPAGYNLTAGGDGSTGCSPSPETRQKLSRAHTGKTFSAETRRRMSDSAKVKHFSIEHRRNLGLASKGKKRSVEARKRISDGVRGYWRRKLGKQK